MAFLGMAFTLGGAPDQLTALATRFAPLFSEMPQIEIELLQIKTTQIQSQGHFWKKKRFKVVRHFKIIADNYYQLVWYVKIIIDKMDYQDLELKSQNKTPSSLLYYGGLSFIRP